MPCTVSVVIPAHNAEGTVAESVRSAFAQSVAPDEVFVVCDGCTDETRAVAEAAGATTLAIPRSNGSVARNAGARASQGSVLFFLDADDWWEPGKVEAHLTAWDERDVSFVIDRSTPWLSDGRRAYWTGGVADEGLVEWEGFLSHHAWASGSSFSTTRENFASVGGFNERLNKFQDVDFWVRCAERCGPAYALSASYTNYRLSDGPSVSKTTGFMEENLCTLFEGWPFASEDQRAAFASHAYLTAAEVTPWPDSVEYFKKAHWPVTKRFFWKCLYQSLHARRTA